MKKIFLLLAVVAMTFLQGCEGDPGPQGPVGQTGYSAESQVMEITNVNFTAPSYGIIFNYGFQTLNSDHALVYRLSAIDGGNDVWQLIPQYYFYNDGTMNFGYNYDSTINDTSIYLEGQDLGTITDQYRLNQIFRIVIVPGQFTNKSAMSTKYEDVVEMLNIKESDFKKASRKYQN
ncbi:hypothetical protein [Flavobacterium sp.]|uniref:hypothetical protein n=1 Tax=Flavobacterium sp. TaxID=239 RepID=UPI0039E5AC7D